MMFFAVTLTIIGNLQLFEEPFIWWDRPVVATRLG
jgi:hypothetical protein